MRLAPPSGERGRARGYPRLCPRDGAGGAGCLRTHLPWLDDTFLESLTHQDNTASAVRVNATTFARGTVSSWRNDVMAVVEGPSIAALYTFATNNALPLPGDAYTSVWDA